MCSGVQALSAARAAAAVTRRAAPEVESGIWISVS
jgi:hypothetical protein